MLKILCIFSNNSCIFLFFSVFSLSPSFILYYSCPAGVHIIEQSGVKRRRVQVLHLHRYALKFYVLYVLYWCFIAGGSEMPAGGGGAYISACEVCLLFVWQWTHHDPRCPYGEWLPDPTWRQTHRGRSGPSCPSSPLSSLNSVSTLSRGREPRSCASGPVGWQHTLADPSPPPAVCLCSPANPLSVELTAEGADAHQGRSVKGVWRFWHGGEKKKNRRGEWIQTGRNWKDKVEAFIVKELKRQNWEEWKKGFQAKECWRWEISSRHPPSKCVGSACVTRCFLLPFPTTGGRAVPDFFFFFFFFYHIYMLSCQLEWAEKAKEEQSEAKKKRKQKPGETEASLQT